MTNALTPEQYDAHCLGAIINLRPIMRGLLSTRTASVLESIQKHTLATVECDLCYGTRACEHADEYRDCYGCRGADGLPTGIDRSVPVGRIYDHRGPQGRKLSCPVCLMHVQSESACDHCGQAFVRETLADSTPATIEVLLRLSISSKEAA